MVIVAVGKMRSGEAAGSYGIIAEMPKAVNICVSATIWPSSDRFYPNHYKGKDDGLSEAEVSK